MVDDDDDDDDDDECNGSVEPYHNTHMHVLFPMVNSWRGHPIQESVGQ